MLQRRRFCILVWLPCVVHHDKLGKVLVCIAVLGLQMELVWRRGGILFLVRLCKQEGLQQLWWYQHNAFWELGHILVLVLILVPEREPCCIPVQLGLRILEQWQLEHVLKLLEQHQEGGVLQHQPQHQLLAQRQHLLHA